MFPRKLQLRKMTGAAENAVTAPCTTTALDVQPVNVMPAIVMLPALTVGVMKACVL